MKNFLIILFLITSQIPTSKFQSDIQTEILGQWNFEKTTSAEKPAEALKVYFKSDNTGNFNFPEKDSEKFTWEIKNNNKITIKYTGENSLCNHFEGDSRLVLRNRKGIQQLQIIKSGYSIFLSK